MRKQRSKRWAYILPALLLAGTIAAGAQAQSKDDLNKVIAEMNAKADAFKSVQADIEWIVFTKVVDETETQTGKSYFRRAGRDLDAKLDIQKPTPKQLLYSNGKVQIYEEKINRVTERDIGSNKSDADAVMSLGFGGRGDDLLKSYDVTWLGWETIGGIRAAKIQLVGNTPNLQKAFSKAIIWLDPERDIAVQQQFFEGTAGDYRLIRYQNIQYNGKIKDDVFKLHTRGNPEKVHLN